MKINGWKILEEENAFENGVFNFNAGSYIVLESPDKLWKMGVGVERIVNDMGEEDADNFWACIMQSELGDDIFGLEPDPVNPDCIWGLEFPVNKFKNNREVIDNFIKWANEVIFDFEIFIFTKDGEIPDYFNLRIKDWLLDGSSNDRGIIISYIKTFLYKLEKLALSPSRSRSKRGLGAIIGLLDRHPMYKSFLPPRLMKISNKIEEKGITRSYNPGKAQSQSEFIQDCRALWDKYYETPTRSNLRKVLAHLEAMKSSKSERVKNEYTRCLRAANKEVKRLG